jgi:hypothetical protein
MTVTVFRSVIGTYEYEVEIPDNTDLNDPKAVFDACSTNAAKWKKVDEDTETDETVGIMLGDRELWSEQ